LTRIPSSASGRARPRTVAFSAAERRQSANGGDANDGAVAAAAAHDRPCRLDHVGGRKQIDINHAAPFRRGLLAGRDGGAAAGIADEHVDPAPAFFDILRQRHRRGGIGDVSRMDGHVAANLAGCRFESVEAARRKRNRSAFGSKCLGDCKSNAPAGAGDESYAPFELELHRRASSIQRTVMSRYLASAPA
jgi:hypothetical protein